MKINQGYGFADNDAALNGEIPLNKRSNWNFHPLQLSGFLRHGYQHCNHKTTFSVTDSMGRGTPVTVTINFNHNETPNGGPIREISSLSGTATAKLQL